jgi:hypothetical protein
MKRLILAGLVALGTFTAIQVSAPQAQAANCDAVRCMACPEGYVWAPTGNNCCRCIRA